MQSERADKKHEERSSGLNGARADFVASLGRKVSECRGTVAELRKNPAAVGFSEDLQRRLHAMSAGARLLKFEAMAHSLKEAIGVLETANAGTALRSDDLTFIAQVLDDLPALAWGETPLPRAKVHANGMADRAVIPASVLVVGPEDIADGLADTDSDATRTFECERTEQVDAALTMARTLGPDLIVIDSSVNRATELVETLLDDPVTEPVPIVVVGEFSQRDRGAQYIALGVHKTIPRPLRPHTLRKNCEQLLDQIEGKTVRVAFGDPTLEQLAERLAEEVRRGLIESVEPPLRTRHVELGEGAEVLGAVWGAIARVQDVVRIKSGGRIRFRSTRGPDGSIPLAPWLHNDLPGADRAVVRSRGAANDVCLEGRRIVVADDDPGVTWFISDLLRTAGCEVIEALDGEAALRAAFRVSPELVISDILMPRMDGFALCRALKRDISLRDTPVVLLSWKEDLLQRVRELGVSAAAYLRKESDSRSIVARVREVLRPRARLEARIQSEGEVRGRLDNFTARLLVSLVAEHRRNAKLCVRDASSLYEIELRDGAPISACRTTSDGAMDRGPGVLSMLMGVGAGRFTILPADPSASVELWGTLEEQLAAPILRSRAALLALAPETMAKIARVELDAKTIPEYLTATPDPLKRIVRRFMQGVSPKSLLMNGSVPATMLEDLITDLAARGAITAVYDENGIDQLARCAKDLTRHLEEHEPVRRESSLPPEFEDEPEEEALASGQPLALPIEPGDQAMSFASLLDDESVPGEEPANDFDAPCSLEDAVMRQVSERSPEPVDVRTSARMPIVEPGELRRRTLPPVAPTDSGPNAVDEPLAEETADRVSSQPPRLELLPEKDGDEESIPIVVEASKAPPSVEHSQEATNAATESSRTRAEAQNPPAEAADDVVWKPPSTKRRWLLSVALLIVGFGVARYITLPGGVTAGASLSPEGATSPAATSPGASAASTQGAGILEVLVADGEPVRIDNEDRGKGPRVMLEIAPGMHDVTTPSSPSRRVEVRANQFTRVDLSHRP